MAEEGQTNSELKPEAPAVPEEPTVEVVPPADAEVKPSQSETAPAEVAKTELPKKGKKRKWLWWTLGVVIFLALLGVLAWKLKWYMPVFNRIYAASVTFKVREDDTYVIQDATLTFRGTTYKTDAAGQVIVPETVAGNWAVLVSKEGYTSYDGGVSLKRGDNGTSVISLKKEAPKVYSISGLVTDYVSGQALAGAQISFASQTIVTDSAGGFEVKNLAAGDAGLTASKSGYTTNQQTVHVTEKVEPLKIALVPQGQVLFVSNRDSGKRAIYLSDYDGQNQKQLVAPLADTEDFAPLLSPNGKFVVFSSTRDKVANTYTSGYLPQLYIVGIDGKNLKKLNNDVTPKRVQWSGDSQFIYFEAYSDAQQTAYSYRYYNVAKASVTDLGASPVQVVLSTVHSDLVYAVSPSSADDQSSYKINGINLATGNTHAYVDTTINPAQVGSLNGTMRFSADGAFVYYEILSNNERKAFQINVASGEVTSTALVNAPAVSYIPSPGATKKAFLDTRDGKKDLFVVDANGQNETRLTTLGVVSTTSPVSWASGGGYLTFAVVREGESAIYIVSADGGEVRKVVDFTPDDTPVPYY
jgi:Tol biopolymer transport system component